MALLAFPALRGARLEGLQAAVCPSCLETRSDSVAVTSDGQAGEGPWWLLFARASHRDRLLLGMWSYHLRALEKGAASNNVVGIVHRGGFAGTFTTSYGRRGYAVGVERAWAAREWGPAEAMLGYRAGLIYGYDERLTRLAGRTPVLPCLQPLLFLRLGPITADLTYTYLVFSLTVGLPI